MTDDIQSLLPDMHKLDALMPQMAAMMVPTVESMKRMRIMMLTMQATQAGQQDQQAALDQNSTAMGQAFNDSHTTTRSICRRRSSTTPNSNAA